VTSDGVGMAPLWGRARTRFVGLHPVGVSQPSRTACLEVMNKKGRKPRWKGGLQL
jgi:hypothetical protein